MLLPTSQPWPADAPSPRDILIAASAERMRLDFTLFAQRAWHIVEPKRCIWNWHMSAICEHLRYVTIGEIRNLMVMVPPRMTKSLLCSVLWPVWHWLLLPGTQFICASYEQSLSLQFAQGARRLIESAWFQERWGSKFYLLPDENEKEMYRNSRGGYRVSTSVNGKTTGFGGDIQLVDDPHNNKQVESDTIRQGAIEWHDNSWRSRLNDPNKAQKVYVAQRTHDNDIMGHVLEQEGHRWVKLVLPMEFDVKRRCITYPNKGRGVEPGAKEIFRDPRQKELELLNPKRFNSETAEVERDSMSTRAWNAQYQQQPEGAGGLILKRQWWKQWVYPEWHPEAGKERPIPVDQIIEVIQVWDTAFEEDEENDYSACTTWAIFTHRETTKDGKTGALREGREKVCALLLDWYEERCEFPELRKEAIRLYNHFNPEWVLIEKKASGHSLVQELRRKGLPVKAVNIAKGGDLRSRVHSVSHLLEGGSIYYIPRRWSLKLIEQVAKYPAGEHDDTESTIAMAWQYMRKFHDLSVPDDETPEEIAPYKWKKRKYG